MKLKYLLFTTVTVVASCVSLSSKPKPSSLVRLLDANKKFSCSGSVISKNQVLTAAHCVSSSAFIQSSEDYSVIIPVTGMRAYNRMDIAILIADVAKFQHENVVVSPGSILSTHFKKACGFPLGGELYCRNFTTTVREVFQFKCDVDAYPGMSGGPVYSRVSGDIIGVISAVTEDGQTLWTPTTELWNLLGEAK